MAIDPELAILTLKLLPLISENIHQSGANKAFISVLCGVFPDSAPALFSVHTGIKTEFIQKAKATSKKVEQTINIKDIQAELLHCYEQNDSLKFALTETDQVFYYPVSVNQKIHYILRILLNKSNQQNIELLTCILPIFENHCKLINENERDTLTGLLNRKTFDFHILDTIKQQKKILVELNPAPGSSSNKRALENSECSSYWLALLDLDHFKKINDTYGHIYGDEVLLTLSHIMRQSFRANDLLFRYGGEEFLVILNTASAKNAFSVFERFRQKLESHDFPQIGHVTISIGFTKMDTNILPQNIIDQADKALYCAKEHGRNQTYNYQSIIESGLITQAETPDDIEIF